jgi:hypothetical protein
MLRVTRSEQGKRAAPGGEGIEAQFEPPPAAGLRIRDLEG